MEPKKLGSGFCQIKQREDHLWLRTLVLVTADAFQALSIQVKLCVIAGSTLIAQHDKRNDCIVPIIL